jgi:hypothetical protein
MHCSTFDMRHQLLISMNITSNVVVRSLAILKPKCSFIYATSCATIIVLARLETCCTVSEDFMAISESRETNERDQKQRPKLRNMNFTIINFKCKHSFHNLVHSRDVHAWLVDLHFGGGGGGGGRTAHDWICCYIVNTAALRSSL